MDYKINGLQWAAASKLKKEIIQKNGNSAIKISSMFAFNSEQRTLQILNHLNSQNELKFSSSNVVVRKARKEQKQK